MLKDTRKYATSYPKGNIIIQSALNNDVELLHDVIHTNLKKNNYKLISLSMNLAPSYRVVKQIRNTLSLILQNNNKFVFVIPIVIISTTPLKNKLVINGISSFITTKDIFDDNTVIYEELIHITQLNDNINNIIGWSYSHNENLIIEPQKISPSNIEVYFIIGKTTNTVNKENYQLNLLDMTYLLQQQLSCLVIPFYINDIITGIEEAEYYYYELLLQHTLSTEKIKFKKTAEKLFLNIKSETTKIIISIIYDTITLYDIFWDIKLYTDFTRVQNSIITLLDDLQIRYDFNK